MVGTISYKVTVIQGVILKSTENVTLKNIEQDQSNKGEKRKRSAIRDTQSSIGGTLYLLNMSSGLS